MNYSFIRSKFQLLELAIKIDKPQLEARSNELTKKSENMKIQLEQLQQILLQVRSLFSHFQLDKLLIIQIYLLLRHFIPFIFKTDQI